MNLQFELLILPTDHNMVKHQFDYILISFIKVNHYIQKEYLIFLFMVQKRNV